MNKVIAEMMQNNAQTAKLPNREVIKIANFEQVTLTDIHNMFGAWKEADHCDKDIRN